METQGGSWQSCCEASRRPRGGKVVGKGESANAQFQQRLWPRTPILKARDARGAPILGTGIGCGPRRGAAGASLGAPAPPVLAGRAAPGAGGLPRTVDSSNQRPRRAAAAGTEDPARGPHAAAWFPSTRLKVISLPHPPRGLLARSRAFSSRPHTGRQVRPGASGLGTLIPAGTGGLGAGAVSPGSFPRKCVSAARGHRPASPRMRPISKLHDGSPR